MVISNILESPCEKSSSLVCVTIYMINMAIIGSLVLALRVWIQFYEKWNCVTSKGVLFMDSPCGKNNIIFMGKEQARAFFSRLTHCPKCHNSNAVSSVWRVYFCLVMSLVSSVRGSQNKMETDLFEIRHFHTLFRPTHRDNCFTITLNLICPILLVNIDLANWT